MPGRYLVARTGIAVYKRALDFGPFKALTRSQARLPQFPSHALRVAPPPFPSHALRVSTAGSPSRFAGWRQGCAAVLHDACCLTPHSTIVSIAVVSDTVRRPRLCRLSRRGRGQLGRWQLKGRSSRSATRSAQPRRRRRRRCCRRCRRPGRRRSRHCPRPRLLPRTAG